MRTSTLLFIALLLAPFAASANQPPSLSFGLKEVSSAARIQLPGVEFTKAFAEDALRQRDEPPRYAIGAEIQKVYVMGLEDQGGEWTRTADGRWLWRLEVHSPQSLSLDFGFTRYRLPAGAELWVSSPDGKRVRGPYTDADNREHGQHWTPILYGDRALIELLVPEHKRAFVELELTRVNQGYRDLADPWRFEKSGSCNVDVACPEGDAWRPEIASVAAYGTGASGIFCTGQLVNNTSGDLRPLFLTANHCRINSSNAPSVVTYFNYQQSTCRTPGSQASGASGNGRLDQTISGATFLAGSNPGVNGISGSDFSLMRLSSNPPSAYGVSFAGWDRRDIAPKFVAGIHHPNGEEKRISLSNRQTSVTDYANSAGTTHLRVPQWDVGTTEPGSSGSGLWNLERRLVGVLSGGSAACSAGSDDNDLPDWYGRVFAAWNEGNTPDRRMRDHLDPSNSNDEITNTAPACDAPTVSLSSNAFTGTPRAGDVLVFNAAVSGGASGPYQIDWHSDSGLEREDGGTTLSMRYPSATSAQISVTVRDSAGCQSGTGRALDVVAADIAVQSVAAATQICGNGDASIDRGERWRIPVTLRNNGGAALGSGAQALFAQGDLAAAALPLGPDSFGHRASTTAQGGCAHSWIDIVSGANATAALALTDDDDGGALVTLQGGGFSLYGQSVSQVVMSTNGYLSLASSDTGEDWQASCSTYDGSGPRLQVLHDDHVVETGGGLRYRYFSSCPRAGQVGASGQACHVFTWTGLRPFSGTGNAEFQAVLYPASGQAVYQYRSADADNAGFAVVGIGNATFSDFLQIGCAQAGSVTAGSSVCIYNPSNLPASNTTAVRLETATRALPALAAGAQTTVNVDVAIPADASCGAQFAVDYIASADSGSFSKRSASAFTGTISGGSCSSVTSCPAQIPARTERQGLYYNTGRGGNGVSAFLYGPNTGPRVFGGAWFTGNSERLPTWYIIQGSYADNLTRADILRFTNPAAPGGFSPTSQSVGKAWLSFTANDRVMMAWELDDGRDGAELMETLPLASTNRSQAYYNRSQSGWGTVVDTAKPPNGVDQEFVVNYLYDAQGNPVWTLGAHTSIAASAHSFSQDTWRVHCPACPQLTDWGTLTLPAGSMSRTWTGSTTGTISTSITLPAPLSGSWNRSNLPIEALGPVQ